MTSAIDAQVFDLIRELAQELELTKQRMALLETELGQLRARVSGGGQRFAALYADFTDHFRGTSEVVTAKLTPYLADARGLAGARPTGGVVVDVGSGRGEWLTLLRDAGLPGSGVDNNPAFVEAGRARGLDLVCGDAVAHLAGLPPDSVDLVTAFHIIEHLDPDTLLALLAAAWHALRPGGAVLLETPNPANLRMAACDFYNDPTHRSPLPPRLTEYLVSASGFGDIEIRPMNPRALPIELTESSELSEVTEPSELTKPSGHSQLRPAERLLALTLYGPQDYAVLGYKPVPPPVARA